MIADLPFHKTETFVLGARVLNVSTLVSHVNEYPLGKLQLVSQEE
jgi:hypothetical protein